MHVRAIPLSISFCFYLCMNVARPQTVKLESKRKNTIHSQRAKRQREVKITLENLADFHRWGRAMARGKLLRLEHRRQRGRRKRGESKEGLREEWKRMRFPHKTASWFMRCTMRFLFSSATQCQVEFASFLLFLVLQLSFLTSLAFRSLTSLQDSYDISLSIADKVLQISSSFMNYKLYRREEVDMRVYKCESCWDSWKS